MDIDALERKIGSKPAASVRRRDRDEIAREVDRLIAEMSVEEKIGQMCQSGASEFVFGAQKDTVPAERLVREGRVGSILGAFDPNTVFELQEIAVEESRLGIPLLFNGDVIHGHQTVFPVPLAWSCSWNMDAIRNACAVSAREACAAGLTCNHGPMIDISRDPRWGRVVEGAGEDPYLGAQIARSQVEGFQGESLVEAETMIATLKHFVAYGAAEGGRDYNTVELSETALREFYLPPFAAGVAAGAGAVMSSFNVYDAVPVVANEPLLNGLLRGELGFKGMIICDYGSIEELIAHGRACDSAQAAALALEATVDIEMVTSSYHDNLSGLLRDGVIREELIDNAVRRILACKFEIGIMDDPFRYLRPQDIKKFHFCSEHLAASRQLARESIVLLKNDGLLPLDRDSGRLALIGPFADSTDLLGPWQFSSYGDSTVTFAAGIRDTLDDPSRVDIAHGCTPTEPTPGGIEEATRVAAQSDVVILALGEPSELSGEAASRMDISLPEAQVELARAVAAVGKPTIMLLVNGRPLVLEWFEQEMDAIVETWFLGSQAGNAVADVIFGDHNPSAKLTMSFPRHVGQIPVYYNCYTTGRPRSEDEKFTSKYLDGPNDPLYPFGFGLSYTTFEYSELHLSVTKMKRSDVLEVSTTVANTGQREGVEIVQCYIQDLFGSRVRPVKELRRFERISIAPGESSEVTFRIEEPDLRFFTAERVYESEEGEFRVHVGTNSRDVRTATFELVS